MASRGVSDRMVGRDRELAGIAGSLEAASAARPTTVLLAGPAGIGKTRLLDETRRRLEDLRTGFIVLRGTAHPARGSLPFSPVAEALARYLAPLTDDDMAEIVGPSAHEIARIVPGLHDRMAVLGLLPRRRRSSPGARERPGCSRPSSAASRGSRAGVRSS